MTPRAGDDDAALVALLRGSRRIAVVGLSPDPARDSHRVAAYLLERGYEVVPVNPHCERALGRPSFPGLAQARAAVGPIDLVDVFRRADQAAEVAVQAIAIGAPALWLQLGVVDERAAAAARRAGLVVVMDRCLMVEHRRLAQEIARPPRN